MSALHPAAGTVLFLACIAVLIAALHTLQRVERIDAEVTRKLLHIGGGLLSLGLPFLFSSAWHVLLLSGITAAGFLLLKNARSVRVLSGVARASNGEIWFPLGVTAVFALSRGVRLPYIVCVLVMTFADAGAALAGKVFGTTRLSTGKTLEGSAAFFVLAYAGTLSPLLLSRAVAVSHAFAVAYLLAAAVTLVEAYSPYGLDNLLIPVSSFALLKGMLPCN
jgi:phytol kinase